MGIVRQSVQVSVGHRYWNNLWSHERNRVVYGDSASPLGVGSNLRVDVEAEGPQLTVSDLSPSLKYLKEILDHRCLYADSEAFQGSSSTLEDITHFTAQRLFSFPLVQGTWTALTVWELDRFGCRVHPSTEPGFITFIEVYRNLTLSFRAQVDPETHLAVSRVGVQRAIDDVFEVFRHQGSFATSAAWGSQLFGALKERLPNVFELVVDLGCHGVLRLAESDVKL